jgi:aspartyl/glutamyl-tRNA(Asn/Gln) amidotransferase C subunit
MDIISAQDVIKIAQISYIKLYPHEIEPLKDQLQAILTYAERVAQLAPCKEYSGCKNVNIFRQDVAVPADAQAVLKQCPEIVGDYFVVPIILEDS